MDTNKINPRRSLSKAYLKTKINKKDIDKFKLNLNQMLKLINDSESEEFHKNLISRFLIDTFYENEYFINTKHKSDLVIHNGKTSLSSVGVIIEVKKPLNKSEMLSENKLNVKAFQELLLYYLRERITNKNIELKHIVATNLYEWFIFDASVFERLFANDKKLVTSFTAFEDGRLSGKTTDFFYKNLAEPAINKAIKEGFDYTHFKLSDFKNSLSSDKDSGNIVSLYKLLSAEHMLKLPFINDSNNLNKEFYSELLHIIGLSEYKKGTKKLISRKEKNKRNSGSLIENTISHLDSLDKITRIERPNRFGKDYEERLFNVSLELVINWTNRILFLKLLEGQLLNYHKSDSQFVFLNYTKVRNFEDLNNLFFSVLARREEERNPEMKTLFPNVPYLNSSLFEPSELEHSTFFISQLSESKIPLYSSTILKESNGKKRKGTINTLEYLFHFLSSYDFSSDVKDEIREDNKTLINASVLGLIFEKINGYKEGAFFTPGYITMYMCRAIIRKKVLEKFNEIKKWNCDSIEELFDKIEDKREANTIINNIKICDIAVGSGHFLVSALNEILAIKSELKILLDEEGRTLRDYDIEIENDELIVTDEDGRFFTYNPLNKESQRVQKALFNEKKTIIENCLFGVDINPNSVNICRLRLWIELLKNAYYKTSDVLETLPNIDINIKCGNSLISRYQLDTALGKITKNSGLNVKQYIEAVNKYRNAENKQEKREMEELITAIKNNFVSQIALNDTERLSMLRQELNFESNQLGFFELTKEEKKLQKEKIKVLKDKVKQQEIKLEEKKNNKIYENVFEWRFEFPEVLDDKGKFSGFDVIIGNPPYIRVQNINNTLVDHYFNEYSTPSGKLDISILFFEKGLSLLNKGGYLSYISSSQWMQTDYGEKIRELLSKGYLHELVDFGSLPVFKDADTYPAIFIIGNETKNEFSYTLIKQKQELNYKGVVEAKSVKISNSNLSNKAWSFNQFNLVEHLEQKKIRFSLLGDEEGYADVLIGTLTGMDKAFVVSKNEIKAKQLEEELLIPYAYRGEEIEGFNQVEPKVYIIYPYKSDSENNAVLILENELISKYPNIYNHLLQYKDELMERKDSRKFYAREHWYRYLRKGSFNYINPQKLMFKGIGTTAKVGLLNGFTAFNGANCPGIILRKYSKDNILYLLGILNSSLITQYLNSICPRKLGGYYRYNALNIATVPIVEAGEEVKRQVIDKVSQILELKDFAGLSKELKEPVKIYNELDSLIFKIYDIDEVQFKQ